MSEKPARCQCGHTRLSHEIQRVPNRRTPTWKHIGRCWSPCCLCLHFSRSGADIVSAAFEKHRHILETRPS